MSSNTQRSKPRPGAVARLPRGEGGAHSFGTRATDTVGNVDSTPATRSFTIDTEVEGSAKAKKTQKQKGKKIVVKAKVTAGENLDAEASGKVKLGKKSYKLKQADKERLLRLPRRT